MVTQEIIGSDFWSILAQAAFDSVNQKSEACFLGIVVFWHIRGLS